MLKSNTHMEIHHLSAFIIVLIEFVALTVVLTLFKGREHSLFYFLRGPPVLSIFLLKGDTNGENTKKEKIQ